MIAADLIADLRRTFGAALAHDDPAKARTCLLKSGWLEALEADEPIAVSIVFRIQGATRHDAAALDDVITSRLSRRFPDAAPDPAVAYPLRTGPGPTSHVVLAAHKDAQHLLWIDDIAGEIVETVELQDGLDAQPTYGIDPDFGLLMLEGQPPGRKSRLEGPDLPALWTAVLAAGRIAVAHQMIAGAERTLAMALAYARDRKQFGTAIGSFQAVKHRLSETLVAVSAADSATVAAAIAPSATSAAVANVMAGRAAATAAKNCLQVFGGIGFTSEHEFHRYLRRNLVLNRFLADPVTIQRQLGRQIRSGEVTRDGIVNIDDYPRVELIRVR